jgi:cellulose synthase/poly-beta-1,6-N-acetylglucosamine synthase-like glycosyltransferase
LPLLGFDLFVHDFINGFITWISSLTIWDFIALTWFTFIIDISRNLGKVVILGMDNLKRKKNRSRIPLGFAPRLSIIVPAHNEGSAIKKTIMSLLENTYPNKEIIVVDDHSTDNTYQEALPYMQKGLIKLVQRKQGKGSKSAAINYGAVFATGDYIMIMDGDTLLERTAIHEVIHQLGIPGVSAVSGNVRILSGDGGKNNLLTRLQAYEYLIAFEIGRRYNALMNMLIIIPGAFGVFPRSTGKEIGMYDRDTIGEDFDLTIKVLKAGGKVSFASDAIAWTYCPNNWKSWLRQRVRWAHGQLSVLIKHKDMTNVYSYRRQLVMAIYDMIVMDIVLMFVRIGGIVWVAFTYSDTLAYVLLMMFMLYLGNELVAILTAAISSPRKRDLRYVYLAPAAVLFYRPFYSYVRLYAYLKRLFGKETSW